METVKISPKFQVVIPKRLRNALKLSPGQKVQMVVYDNRIEILPFAREFITFNERNGVLIFLTEKAAH